MVAKLLMLESYGSYQFVDAIEWWLVNMVAILQFVDAIEWWRAKIWQLFVEVY